MNKLMDVQLRSVDLANYAVPIPCFICGNGNKFDASSCRYCQAPLALTRQTHGQATRPHMIASIGASNSGKSVYLGMLIDVLSRQHDQLRMVTRGAFSVSLQQQLVSSLSHCRFPESTSNDPSAWHWIHCQVHAVSRRRPLELIIPDASGNMIAREFEPVPGCIALRSLMTRASGSFIFLDAQAMAAGERDDEFFAMKAISNLCEIHVRGQPPWTRKPVAVVLTKGDTADSCFDGPTEFLRQYAPGLLRLCQDRLQRFQAFAVSTVGGVAFQRYGGERLPVPLRVEPRGIIPPFKWLVEQIEIYDREIRSWFRRRW